MCSFSKELDKLILIISKNSPNEFIIMQLSLTYHSPGVTILFRKFWFKNDTLIQVRYRHLLGI